MNGAMDGNGLKDYNLYFDRHACRSYTGFVGDKLLKRIVCSVLVVDEKNRCVRWKEACNSLLPFYLCLNTNLSLVFRTCKLTDPSSEAEGIQSTLSNLTK